MQVGGNLTCNGGGVFSYHGFKVLHLGFAAFQLCPDVRDVVDESLLLREVLLCEGHLLLLELLQGLGLCEVGVRKGERKRGGREKGREGCGSMVGVAEMIFTTLC